MKRLLLVMVVLLAAASAAAQDARERVSLDAGWRFAFGHAADVTRDFAFGEEESYSQLVSWRGAVKPDFDDAAWRALDLPHDWVPELPFVTEPKTDQLDAHGYKPIGRQFPATSIGWYRKRFTVSQADFGSRRFTIEFDGVFRECHVWLNGALIGRHEGGYAPFAFDATDNVKAGENVLVVRVDATHAEGWFYEGAGIYRHVWLLKTAAAHVARYGTFVAPTVKGTGAEVRVTTEVANDSDEKAALTLAGRVLAPDGRVVATLPLRPLAVAPRKSAQVSQVTLVPRVVLWSIENPALYRLETTLRAGTHVVDRVVTPFGVRTLRFDADRGFFLNGKHVQINGFCNHQDHAGVGSALPEALIRYRLRQLKAMGANAYRSSHNPPTPALLDAADEIGLLVMDETRLFSSTAASLEQLGEMVRRDRNHPSVFLWSIGNEESEQGTERGHRVAASMIRTVKALDTTRPVSYASNSGFYAGINELVDVRGFNYHVDEIDRYHREHPKQPLFGSEIASTLCTRGEYAVDPARGYMSSYDRDKPRWGERAEEWMRFYAERPWLAGAFVWTGFDYRGEPTPYQWPCINSHFGILDTCGFPKDLFWYYKSWWTTEPVVHVLPHWNWPGREGQPIEVWAFTNADEVRLVLNGRDLGTRKVEKLGHAEWQVPYEPGRLEAVGLRSGKEIGRDVVETTGTASRLTLAVNGDARLAIVNASALDEQGRRVPVAGNDVTFEVSGPGRIIGVGNGDPSSHEPDKFLEAGATWHRKLFNGYAQVIVQRSGPGEIQLRATAAGLQPATVTVAR